MVCVWRKVGGGGLTKSMVTLGGKNDVMWTSTKKSLGQLGGESNWGEAYEKKEATGSEGSSSGKNLTRKKKKQTWLALVGWGVVLAF